MRRFFYIHFFPHTLMAKPLRSFTSRNNKIISSHWILTRETMKHTKAWCYNCVWERERERVRVRVRVRVRPEGALLALHVICQSGPDCRPSSGNWGDEGMAQMNHLVSIYKVRFPVSYNYLAKYNSFLMEILKIVQVNNCMFNYFVWHYYKPHRLVSLFTIRGIQKA